MKRLFTLILILFCFGLLQELKAQILWERIETDLVTFRDEYRKILVKDSLIYLNGIGTWTYGHDRPSFYSCYNFNGKLKWRKNGRDSYAYYPELILDTDSTLLSYRFNGNWFKLDLLRIRTATGDTLPPRQFTVPYSLYGITNGFMVKEPAGGYTIGGTLPGNNGPSITRLSSSGSPLWTKRHNWNNAANNTNLHSYTDFKRKPNGNYVMLADFNTDPNSGHAQHPGLIEFKPNGDTLRSRKFVLEHSTYNEQTFYSKLTLSRDGGYLFTGRIDTVVDNCNGCDVKYFVTKIDKQLNLKWTYINKGILKEYEIERGYELADSSFALLALTYTPTQKNYAIIKISKTGQYLSHTTYANSFCNGMPMIHDWVILPDGTSIVAGKCKHHGYTYLARLASVGAPAVLGGSEEVAEISNYGAEAFPNPATESVTFKYNLLANCRQAKIIIYEIATGKEVQKLQLRLSEKQQQVSLSKLNSGLYAYTLSADGIPVSTKKLVVVK